MMCSSSGDDATEPAQACGARRLMTYNTGRFDAGQHKQQGIVENDVMRIWGCAATDDDG